MAVAPALVMSLLGATLAAGDRIESEDLVGFSPDGRAAAVRVRVAEPRPGPSWDSYTLIRIVDVATGQVTETFRASSILRIDDAGRPRRLPQGTLVNMNPTYRRARPQGHWERLASRLEFQAEPVDLGHRAVRLRPDPDASMNGDNDGASFYVRGDPGSPVGYTVVVRTAGGRSYEAAHFRRQARGGEPVAAEVRVFASPDGRSLAIANTFALVEADRVRAVTEVVTRRLDAPVAGPGQTPPDSDVVSVARAYHRYVGAYGGGVPQHLARPQVIGRNRSLAPTEAAALYATYTRMFGGELDF